MGDFEYLANLSMGQYLPLGSFLHERDPRAKLVGITLLVLSITLANSLGGVGMGLAGVLLLLGLSRLSVSQAVRGLLPPLPFLLILAILQVFITPHIAEAEPVLIIFGVQIFMAGLRAAALLVIKFVGLILLFSISSASISTLELIHGIEMLFKPLRRLGLRTEAAAMTLQITFRFVPFLAINAERIAKSQASRGAEWGSKKMNLFKRVRQIVPLLVPLFNNSLRQAETLADAMLARGYVSEHPRSSLWDYRFNWLDAAFLTGNVIVAFLILNPVF